MDGGPITALTIQIQKNIIHPALTEQNIKDRATSLGYGTTLNEKSHTNLYDTIFNELIRKIETYMRSDEASSICDRALTYQPQAMFGNTIQEKLDSQLKKIYSSEPTHTPNASHWFWSLLGY